MLKEITVIVIVISLTGLSLTALIMSTGKYWRCPGQTSLFSWLLGFGINGILFCWLCFVIMIERHLQGYYNNDRPVIIFYGMMIIISYIFAFIWSIVGIRWTGSTQVKSTDYYINGTNLYCDSAVLQYTQSMSILTLILTTISLSIAAHRMKNSH